MAPALITVIRFYGFNQNVRPEQCVGLCVCDCKRLLPCPDTEFQRRNEISVNILTTWGIFANS